MNRAAVPWVMALLAMISLAATSCLRGTGPATTATDWSQYLGGPLHSSVSSTTTVTKLNAGSLHMKWVFHAAAATMTGQPAPTFVSSPTVSGGQVFIGSNSGVFYALNETTGSVVWKHFLGFEPKLTCGSIGMDSTAAEDLDPVSGLPTVYASGGDGNLYAFDAATGNQNWKSVIALRSATKNDYYDWSSPTVGGGKIYVGVTSECDVPLVRGGVREFDQATGNLVGTYQAVASGQLGGGVWSSVAVTPDVKAFATTGNTSKTTPGDGQSIVRLDGANALARLDAWKVPASQINGDDDFGASPTIFSANLGGVQTSMIGACNKNGIFYALRADNLALGPVWTFKVAAPSTAGAQACLGAAVSDGTNLYIAGGATTIRGTIFAGSVRQLDPSTGTAKWELGLNSVVLGSMALDGAGVLAAATYGKNVIDGVYLIDASAGKVIKFMGTGKEFSQPVFADSFLMVASKNNLTAYGP
jgi:outer membrane protein assembly factor BamB